VRILYFSVLRIVEELCVYGTFTFSRSLSRLLLLLLLLLLLHHIIIIIIIFLLQMLVRTMLGDWFLIPWSGRGR